MSPNPSLYHYQRLASSLEADVDALALRLGSQAAHLHAIRAVGMLSAAVRELGTAAAHEQLRAADAPSNDGLLTVQVISPGADRADALVRAIPANVVSMCDRAAAYRLGLSHDAEGCRAAGEILRRHGWARAADGFWNRPGYVPTATAGQPR